MNSLIENEMPGNRDLRDSLFDMISDNDLAYQLPGNNPTLGALCEEMGDVQQAYTGSFRTLRHDWGDHPSRPETANRVESLKAWFEELDAELVAALSELSEDDVQNKRIDRGHGFVISPYVQFQIYREALLIFYAKASVYLKALEKPLNDQWKSWVG